MGYGYLIIVFSCRTAAGSLELMIHLAIAEIDRNKLVFILLPSYIEMGLTPLQLDSLIGDSSYPLMHSHSQVHIVHLYSAMHACLA